MRKQVYLFELDSVRKTDEEIIAGQKAMYNEIVVNGNIVVMTFNQMIDSRGFFSLLDNKSYYENLLQLFEKGALRISQFGEVRTLAQYLLNTLENERKFIYSALPIKYTQRRLLALMRRSLMYSDLSEIFSYTRHGKTSNSQEEKRLKRELFVEIKDGRPQDCSLSDEQIQNILDQLYWFLSLILRLSTMHHIYRSPRRTNDYNNLLYYDIIEMSLKLTPWTKKELWGSAVEIIRELECYKSKSRDRSDYLHEIKESYDKCNSQKKKKDFQFAEAILNNCYNYTCEISISDVSKHYIFDELLCDTPNKPTFESDFFARLEEDWRDGECADIRYLRDDTNEFQKFEKLKEIPRMSTAVHVTEYVEYQKEADPENIHTYEYAIKDQRIGHGRKIRKSIMKNFLGAVGCILIACVLELVSEHTIYSWISALLSDMFGISIDKIKMPFILKTVLCESLKILILLLIAEIVTATMAKFCPGVLSLSDALKSIRKALSDRWRVWCSRKSKNIHINTEQSILDYAEEGGQGERIPFIISKELKKYKAFQKQQKNSSIFRTSSVYTIADVEDSQTVHALIRTEEDTGCKFGEVYKSIYNRVIVDPIKADNGSFFGYERILPTVELAGVVIVPKYEEKFVLLRQYRHALREEEFSFPRGCSESDSVSAEQDVERELEEELGCKAKSISYLGNITPDSGLQAKKVATYLVEVDDIQKQIGHEGIQDVILLSEEEMRVWIRQGKICDGFTLGAYLLSCV